MRIFLFVFRQKNRRTYWVKSEKLKSKSGERIAFSLFILHHYWNYVFLFLCHNKKKNGRVTPPVLHYINSSFLILHSSFFIIFHSSLFNALTSTSGMITSASLSFTRNPMYSGIVRISPSRPTLYCPNLIAFLTWYTSTTLRYPVSGRSLSGPNFCIFPVSYSISLPVRPFVPTGTLTPIPARFDGMLHFPRAPVAGTPFAWLLKKC